MIDTPIVVETRGLTKIYGDGAEVRALDGVDLIVHAGELIAIVGPSGSGKSTLLHIIGALDRPTAGEVIINGQSLAQVRDLDRFRSQTVGFIFQTHNLIPTLTARENVEVPLYESGLSRAARRARAEELLTMVGLGKRLEFLPNQLSGGERQRVAIARALAVDPQIILADEPISMLDVSIRMGVLNLMEQLKEAHGIGYLYITHDIASARYIGDLTMVMYAGHMVEGAESQELIAQPAHPYTRLLLSAVPNPHAGLAKRTVAARGEVPSLIDPPPGCPFAARCPQVIAACREAMPAVTAIGAKHWARCHLYN
jgi:peptide/nickel transport system ATP-binding protein